jgi:hypothetical protein
MAAWMSQGRLDVLNGDIMGEPGGI